MAGAKFRPWGQTASSGRGPALQAVVASLAPFKLVLAQLWAEQGNLASASRYLDAAAASHRAAGRRPAWHSACGYPTRVPVCSKGRRRLQVCRGQSASRTCRLFVPSVLLVLRFQEISLVACSLRRWWP